MKQLIVRPVSQLIILATFVFSQFIFAGDLIKDRGEPTQPTIQSTYSSYSDMSLSINDVTVEIVASDLMVSFNSPVGMATVSVNDKKGNLVYQTTVDTDYTSEVSVPVSFFNKGNYKVTVSYGTTVFTEQFKL